MTVKFLVKFDCNWADEMDLEGFAIMTPAVYNYRCKEINASNYPVTWYFGTNQEVIFESADEVFKCFDVTVLNSVESEFLEKRVAKYKEYGFTPFDSLEGNAPNEFYEENKYPKEK